MDLKQARENAINDIKSSIKKQNMAFLDNSIGFADRVTKSLVAKTLSTDVDNIFNFVFPTIGSIKIDIDEKHYLLELNIVNKNYKFNYNKFDNKTKKAIEYYIGMLINNVKAVYPAIYKETSLWAVNNNKHFGGKLIIDDDLTMYIDDKINQRIGIVIRPI